MLWKCISLKEISKPLGGSFFFAGPFLAMGLASAELVVVQGKPAAHFADACFAPIPRLPNRTVLSPAITHTIYASKHCGFVFTANMPGRTGSMAANGAGPSQRKRSRRAMEDASGDDDDMEVVAVAEASSSLQHSSVRLRQLQARSTRIWKQ